MSCDSVLEVASLVYYDSVIVQLFILNKIYEEYGISAIQMTW